MPGIAVQRRPVHRRQPAAPEQQCVKRAHQDDVAVLAEPEERERHRAIFGLVTGDELALRLDQVERRAERLRHRADQKHDRHREQQRIEPDSR